MSGDYKYDLAVIGAGPGGYVAAIRATQLGLKCVVIEKEHVGGICLNWGCIPSKALITQVKNFSKIKDLRAMGIEVNTEGFDYSKVYQKSRTAADRLARGVQLLLKRNKIDLIMGTGIIKDKNTVIINSEDSVTAAHILVATGSRPKEIPGFPFDGKHILSSTDILKLQQLPESIIILGGGAIGVEFAYILGSFGVRVTIIEMMERLLPTSDPEIARVLERSFKKMRLNVKTSTKALDCKKKDNKVCLKIESYGKEEEITADVILVAVGRTPNTENLGLKRAGVETERGFIKTGDYFRTTCPSVYAIGDVINTPLLAHLASKEGETAAEHMAGHTPEKYISRAEIPYAVYCEPQVAGFGYTEKQAKAEELPYGAATFPFRGAGKAVAIEEIDGMVKIIFHKENGKILGAHIVGADATEIIHELLLAKKSRVPLKDIAAMVHAHPTLSETLMEAARAAEGWAIHI